MCVLLLPHVLEQLPGVTPAYDRNLVPLMSRGDPCDLSDANVQRLSSAHRMCSSFHRDIVDSSSMRRQLEEVSRAVQVRG
jgi:hypothetical protein